MSSRIAGYQATISKRQTQSTKTAVQESREALVTGSSAVFDEALPAETPRPDPGALIDGTLGVLDFVDMLVSRDAKGLQDALDGRTEKVQDANESAQTSSDLYRTHRNAARLAGGPAWLARLGLVDEPEKEKILLLAQLEHAQGRYQQPDLALGAGKAGAPEIQLEEMAEQIQTAVTDLEVKNDKIETSHKEVDVRRETFETTIEKSRRIRRGMKLIYKGLFLVSDLEDLVPSLNPRKQRKNAEAVARGRKGAVTRSANAAAALAVLAAKVPADTPTDASADAPADDPSADPTTES
jgi:hypothetical protein